MFSQRNLFLSRFSRISNIYSGKVSRLVRSRFTSAAGPNIYYILSPELTQLGPSWRRFSQNSNCKGKYARILSVLSTYRANSAVCVNNDANAMASSKVITPLRVCDAYHRWWRHLITDLNTLPFLGKQIQHWREKFLGVAKLRLQLRLLAAPVSDESPVGLDKGR